jgi:hypothetical protein
MKLAGATAETAFKSLTLGKDGFSAAISPLFRVLESLRGNDSTERRATRLVLETVSYAITKTTSSIQLPRPPLEAELQAIVEHLLSRTQTLQVLLAFCEGRQLILVLLAGSPVQIIFQNFLLRRFIRC